MQRNHTLLVIVVTAIAGLILLGLALWYFICCANTVQATLSKRLEAIRSADTYFNSFITLDEAGAMAQAKYLDKLKPGERGALHGLMVAVKDNIDVAGIPSTAGTDILRNYIPKSDALAVARLKKAGATVIGKTNMHELAFGITSNNYVFGAVRNAHNPDMFAGGSSGGTAVAIALGFIDVGLGSDTGGSSRIPAALNGIVGLRPTLGRYPREGLMLLSTTRDTIGPMGRTVDDIILLDRVLSEDETDIPRVSPNTLRLGVPRGYFYENLDPEMEKLVEGALRAFAQAGIELVEADLEGIAELNNAVSFPVVLYESKHLLPRFIRRIGLPMNFMGFIERIRSPDVRALLTNMQTNPISADVYQQALALHRPKLKMLYQNYFLEHKVAAIVFPTTPLVARPIIGSDQTITLNGKQQPTFLTYIRNVDPSSNADIPGLTIPMGYTEEGLSAGLEIETLSGQDKRLLAIGQLLESILAQR